MSFKSDKQRKFMFYSLKNKTSMPKSAAEKFIKDSGVSQSSINKAEGIKTSVPKRSFKFKSLLKGLK